MSPHAYSEELLVEQPAIGLLDKLGWQTTSAMEEVLGPEGTLGRETQTEVVLFGRLRAALKRLNPGLPDEAVASAVEELTRDRSAMSLAAANREVYGLLKDGVKVSLPDREKGGRRSNASAWWTGRIPRTTVSWPCDSCGCSARSTPAGRTSSDS